jgi:periplasmic divalent cation tolerance protein
MQWNFQGFGKKAARRKTMAAREQGLGAKANGYVVVVATCGSRREAGRIARTVVTKRLAACVNVLDVPVRSIYRWKRKVEEAREFLLMMKTSRERFAALSAEIERLHSYDTPEVISLPIVAGSPKYLAWLSDSVRT